jgi:uncharacterized membrane protein YkvA (DUF1232 family)
MTKSPASLTTWQVLRLLRHLPNFAKLYWRLFTDQRVPLRAKAVLLAGLLYVLNPFDLLPFLLFPFLGALDDLTVFLLAAQWFISLCPPDVVQERVREISEGRET